VLPVQASDGLEHLAGILQANQVGLHGDGFEAAEGTTQAAELVPVLPLAAEDESRQGGIVQIAFGDYDLPEVPSTDNALGARNRV